MHNASTDLFFTKRLTFDSVISLPVPAKCQGRLIYYSERQKQKFLSFTINPPRDTHGFA